MSEINPVEWLAGRQRIANKAWHKGEWRVSGELNYRDVWAEVPGSPGERVVSDVWASDADFIVDARNHATAAYRALESVLNIIKEDQADSHPDPTLRWEIEEAIKAELGKSSS